MSVLDWVGRTVQSVRLPVDGADKLKHNLRIGPICQFTSPSQHSTGRMDAWDEIPAPWVADLLDALELPDAAFDPSAILCFVREHLLEQRFVSSSGLLSQTLLGLRRSSPWTSKLGKCESVHRSFKMKNIPGDVRVVSQPQDWDAINKLNGQRPSTDVHLMHPDQRPRLDLRQGWLFLITVCQLLLWPVSRANLPHASRRSFTWMELGEHQMSDVERNLEHIRFCGPTSNCRSQLGRPCHGSRPCHAENRRWCSCWHGPSDRLHLS